VASRSPDTMEAFDQYAGHTIAHMQKMLRNLDRWIERAIANAEARKYDAEVLVQARLAPDQYAFVRQVQSACDTAKFAAARLAGKDAPSHPDTETTIAQLRERIASVVGWLEGFGPSDFAHAGSAKLSLPWMRGKAMTGVDYLSQFAVPNFYFHLTTAYSILRHNGVDVGKMDYLGGISMQDP